VVEKPEDALSTFERSGLPHMFIGSFLVSKAG
jgi:predicted NodU family carbamoyl transferase